MKNSIKIRIYKNENAKILKRYKVLTYFFLGEFILLFLVLIQVIYKPFHANMFFNNESNSIKTTMPLTSSIVSNSLLASEPIAMDSIRLNIYKDESVLSNLANSVELNSDKSVLENTTKNSIETSIISSDTNIISHRVEKGQTLYSISNLYKVSVKDIARINSIENNIIVIGEILKIQKK